MKQAHFQNALRKRKKREKKKALHRGTFEVEKIFSFQCLAPEREREHLCLCFAVHGQGHGCGCVCPPSARTSGHASPTHRDICVCRAYAWDHVCEHVWLCTFLWLCSCLQAVAAEHPWPLCGHMSLCWGVSITAASPGLPLRAHGPFSPKKKGHVL